MKEFKFAIGDWSGDGHEKTDNVHFKSNKTADEIRKAYWDSCIHTSIAFHNQDLTTFDAYNRMSKDIPVEKIKFRLLHNYEDTLIPAAAMKILYANGLSNKLFEDGPNEGGDQYIMNAEELSELLLWFISISLDDFEYKVIKDEVESINGFWNKNLNVGFGYGLYY